MDFSNPGVLFSGLAVSTVGFGLFLHGKKASQPKNLFIGLAMMIYPIFVHSVIVMWLIGAACMAGAYFMPAEL